MAAGVPDGGALKGWRAMIADHTNDALERAGHDARVDARSYKDLGIDQVPTVHQGKEATALKRKGERTRQGDKQKVVQALNGSLASAKLQRAPEKDENADSGTRGGGAFTKNAAAETCAGAVHRERLRLGNRTGTSKQRDVENGSKR